MSGKKPLFEDGSKKVFTTDSEEQLLYSFVDTIVSSDGKKNGRVKRKGALNNAIAAQIFEYLASYNIMTNFIEKVDEKELHVKATELIPITVTVHNYPTSILARRYGFDKKSELPVPVLEMYYDNEKLNHPMVNEFHAAALDLASQEEMRTMAHDAMKINAILKPFLERRNINLAGFNLHFGRQGDFVILSKEITPDTCRLWDMETGEPLCQERFDKDLGKVGETYRDVHDRILGEN